ncbi:MFS transporter [Amnibacterium setariae]|uniref:MFS transporter n=1 Tax=Amnibacterium setariae TaxID=2306585 RepID=UPI0013141802|nr:MFS transporter [Amnibacterium setariae]
MRASTPDDAGHPWRAVVVLAFGAFAVGTGLFALSGVLPEAARDLDVSTAAVGQAVTVFAVVYAVGAPLLAALAGRFALKPVLLVALVLLVVGNLLTAAAPDLPLLLASRVVAALGAALYTPAALGAAAALVGPDRAGAALAVVQGGLNGALAVGVPIGLGISGLSTWRSALLVVAVLGVLAAVGVAVGTRSLPRARAVRPAAVLALARSGPALLVLLVTVLVVAAGISAYTYVSEILGATVHASGAALLLLLIVYGLGAFGGTLAAGPLVDRFAPRGVLLATIALQAVVLALVPVLRTPLVAIPLVLLWGATFTASTPPQQVRVIELAPDSPTVAVSLNSSSIYAGQGLGAVIGGLVLGSGLAASSLPFVSAGIAVVGLLVALVRPRARPDVAEVPAA